VSVWYDVIGGFVVSVKSTENESEVVNQSHELRSDSVPSHSASPPSFNAVEEDKICPELSHTEEETAVENEAVSIVV